jgi:hypothetical protein
LELVAVVEEFQRALQSGEVAVDVGEGAEFQWPAWGGGPVCFLETV